MTHTAEVKKISTICGYIWEASHLFHKNVRYLILAMRFRLEESEKRLRWYKCTTVTDWYNTTLVHGPKSASRVLLVAQLQRDFMSHCARIKGNLMYSVPCKHRLVCLFSSPATIGIINESTKKRIRLFQCDFVTFLSSHAVPFLCCSVWLGAGGGAVRDGDVVTGAGRCRSGASRDLPGQHRSVSA